MVLYMNMKQLGKRRNTAVSYTHLRAHETDSYLVCRLLLEKKKKRKIRNVCRQKRNKQLRRRSMD